MRERRRTGRRRERERGSALLIVFVFAAIVAITLYMEMPVAAFEAQRQKENLLVTRGNEYAHAVKLFVRKVGHYPNSLKDLEDTNRMRFLRHDFADPFTGKKDWRLLHAGPGGTIIDSKVKGGILLPGVGNVGGANGGGTTPTSTAAFPNTNNGAGSQGGFGAGSFANSSNNSGGFGAGSNADSTPPEVTVLAPRQRGPAVSANGGGPGSAANADAASDPMAAPPGTGDAPTGANVSNDGSAASVGVRRGRANTANDPSNAFGNGGMPGLAQTGDQENAQAANGVNAPTAIGAADAKSNFVSAGNGQQQGGFGQQQQGGFGQQQGGFGQQQQGGFGQQQGSSFGTSQQGVLNSGGVAGVASKAGGHSIKTVNDQTSYSLWEFYYDPRKDVTPGGAQIGAYAQNGTAGGQTTAGQSGNAYGAGSSFSQGFASGQNASGGGQSSGFGQSSFGQNSNGIGNQRSGFGQSSSGQNATGDQTSGFGQSSFGQNSTGGQSPGFGQSSFGQNNSSSNTNQTSGTQQNSNPQ